MVWVFSRFAIALLMKYKEIKATSTINNGISEVRKYERQIQRTKGIGL